MKNKLSHLDNIRVVALDRNAWLALVNERLKLALQWGTSQIKEEKLKKVYTDIISQTTRKSAEIIYDCTDSPIEKIFLASLLILFIDNYPGGFAFERPIANTSKFLENYQVLHRLSEKLWNRYCGENNNATHEGFRAFLKKEEEPRGMTKAIQEHIFLQAVSISIGLTNGYFFIPQASFPDIKIDDKSIRVDLLIWRAGKDKKTIIECDGYKYHKGKAKFTTDRKRYRILLHKGFDIFPFSGSEIYNNPVESAAEIFGYLLYHGKVAFSHVNKIYSNSDKAINETDESAPLR